MVSTCMQIELAARTNVQTLHAQYYTQHANSHVTTINESQSHVTVTLHGTARATHVSHTSSKSTLSVSFDSQVCCTRGVPGASPHSFGAAGAAGAAITSVEVGVMATW